MNSPHLADSPLTEQDVRDMVRLLGEVIAGPDGIRAKRHMLMNGLCDLIQANTWIWSTAGVDQGRPAPFIVSEHGDIDPQFVARCIEAMSHAVTGPAIPHSSPGPMMPQRTDAGFVTRSTPSGFGSVMTSMRPMENGRSCGIGIFREPGRPHFSERESRIANIILSEVPWLHCESFPETSGRETATLYPRHRTILNLLRQGWSRKDIADQLEISVNTVYGYTKAIFKHYGVHSQAELITHLTKSRGNLPDVGL